MIEDKRYLALSIPVIFIIGVFAFVSGLTTNVTNAREEPSVIITGSGSGNTTDTTECINVGSGTVIIKNSTSGNCYVKSLVAGSSISLSNGTNTITITNSNPESTDCFNVGNGIVIIKNVTSNDCYVKSLLSANAGLTITNGTNTITFTNAYTCTSAGGTSIIKTSTSGVSCDTKGITVTSPIVLTSNTNDLNISCPTCSTNTTSVTSLTSANSAITLSGSTGAITMTPKWQLLGQYNLTSAAGWVLLQNSGTNAFRNLDNTNKAVGEHLNANSALIGKVVNRMQLGMQKSGSPTGTLSACTIDSSNNCVYTFGTLDVSRLTTSVTAIDFINTASSVTLAQGDYIGVKYTGGTAANFVQVGASTADVYDSTNSRLALYTSSWQADTNTDLGSSTATWLLFNEPITVSFTAKNNLYITFDSRVTTGSLTPSFIFNGDDDAISLNYASRASVNGAADTTLVSNGGCYIGNTAASSGDNPLIVLTINDNNSADRKLVQTAMMYGANNNAATAPSRIEGVCKWNNTTDPITKITMVQGGGTNSQYNTGSLLTVWGYD